MWLIRRWTLIGRWPLIGSWRAAPSSIPLLLVLSTFALAACVGDGSAVDRGSHSRSVRTERGDAGDDRSIALQLLTAVHQHRQGRGLERVRELPEMSQVAVEHARSMARAGDIDHRGFERRWRQLRDTAGLVRLAENLSLGQDRDGDAAIRVLRSWLDSPQHRGNVEGAYQLVGVGVARDDREALYVVMLFGARN